VALQKFSVMQGMENDLSIFIKSLFAIRYSLFAIRYSLFKIASQIIFPRLDLPV